MGYNFSCTFASMKQPKESVVISHAFNRGILEEVFQVVGLNVGKVLAYIPMLTTCMTN